MHLFERYQTEKSPKKHAFASLDVNDCALLPNRIDIWRFPLHEQHPYDRIHLNQQELIRADRFHFHKHQRRFTVARASLRLILAHYLQESSPDTLIFHENKYGKPELLHTPFLTFNLSHSKDWALLAIGCHYAVGIDLEFFSGRSYLGIGQQLFSPEENRLLEQTPPSLQALSFFHIWSQKEAFIKACGMGLSYPTHTFSVSPLPVDALMIEDTLHKTWWKMTSFMPEIACAAAICYHPNIETIRYISLKQRPIYA